MKLHFVGNKFFMEWPIQLEKKGKIGIFQPAQKCFQ